MTDNIPKHIPPKTKKLFIEAGRRGGRTSSSELTPAERKARASMAAKARWAKKK
jgi:hypothetical protein